MAYCKFCGMESKVDEKCEWCGREIAAVPARVANSPQSPTHVDIAGPDTVDVHDNRSIPMFLKSSSPMVILCMIFIAWKPELYPQTTLGILFVAAMMLGGFGLITPFEDDWMAFVLPFILVLIFPAMLVFIAYAAYALVTREMSPDLMWLFGTYFIILILMQIMYALFGPQEVSVEQWVRITATEALGMAAILGGWMCSRIVSRIDR